MSISKLLRRCPVVNPEILSLILAKAKVSLSLPGIIIIGSLRQVFFTTRRLRIIRWQFTIRFPMLLDKKLLKSRSRFGLEMVDKKLVKGFF